MAQESTYYKQYQSWIESTFLSEEDRLELIFIKENDAEIKDRFGRGLEFGTGGIRGVMKIGSSNMNVYTVRQVTQALANYLLKSRASDEGVVSVAIAHDSRYNATLFSREAAYVLIANGIQVYLFESLRPTPELSFTIRHLNCKAGIVITASHNPPEYNGYKVYGEDGGQITLEMAQEIKLCIQALTHFDQIRTLKLRKDVSHPLLHMIGESVDRAYIDRILTLRVQKEAKAYMADLKVVYTPLHGSGHLPVKRVLEIMGCKSLFIVAEQAKPDGGFTTVKSPNPEEHEAFDMAIELGKKKGADILIGTDPDCDRVGVVVRDHQGVYQYLNGNQVGALLTDYILKYKDKVTDKDAVIKTIVTSDLGAIIAESYGATVFETLTGFKYIGEKIEAFESLRDYNFVFGYEESYGYLAGTFVRDKDAVIASMLIVEMAAFYKHKGMTLLDVMADIYKQYGYYKEDLFSLVLKGDTGLDKIKHIMRKASDMSTWTSIKNTLYCIENYNEQKRYYMREADVPPRVELNESNATVQDNKTVTLDLPKSNVIKLVFMDKSWIAIRPSGTEPKLKVYYSANADSEVHVDERLIALKTIIKESLEI